jgi:D-alanyl-D-alanine carboxypeptidase
MLGQHSPFGKLLLVMAAAGLISNSAVSAADEGSKSSSSQTGPLTKELCAEMRLHKTLRASGNVVDCQRLALVKFSYRDFEGKTHDDGEIVVLDAAAEHVAKIFDALLSKGFPIHQAKLLNNYDGDDEASMSDNNTSAFNDRAIAGGSSVSIHAYGLAIDVNPVQNPFCQKQIAVLHVSPKAGEKYLKRSDVRPGMAEDVVDIFADNGFPIWGGDWRNPTDYQHFQVSRSLARALAQSSSADAKLRFEKQIEEYHRCRETGRNRKMCIAGAPT